MTNKLANMNLSSSEENTKALETIEVDSPSSQMLILSIFVYVRWDHYSPFYVSYKLKSYSPSLDIIDY